MADGGGPQLRGLAARLKAAGPAGQGLRKELGKAITEAAKPLAAKIASVEHLAPYMPDRYAQILATDLGVRAARSLSGDPTVTITARARTRKRKVRRLDAGFIAHPIYPRGPRKTWHWQSSQTGGMRAGFFSDPCRDAAPEIRDKVMQALTETARKITA